MSSSVPAHSYYGRPQGDYRLSGLKDARIAAASAPYVGRGNKCMGNDDTCMGIRAKGTHYCMGHLRSIAKKNGTSVQAKPAVEVDVEVIDDAAGKDESE